MMEPSTSQCLTGPPTSNLGITAPELLVDVNILPELPDAVRILNVEHLPGSRWARISRVQVCQSDGGEESYFIKISLGHQGRKALEGEFEATSAIYAVVPNFCPKPIAWGSLEGEPDAYFYLCKYHNFTDALPQPGPLCAKLAELHNSDTSPDGKFGFHCTTFNGDMPQKNDWCDTWESFFTGALRYVLQVREERAGPNATLDALLPALYHKVIPRLLRPMESNGRELRPSLVHGDLWFGNTAVERCSGNVIVFDPAGFYGHNEYELGNWRPERNKFRDGGYFEAYHAHIGRTEPKEDYDDRNALYAVYVVCMLLPLLFLCLRLRIILHYYHLPLSL
ncbi:Fructosamine kinase-domain-containing protein [Chaetomium tenue]|uniref:Fructosamine kinase-domain-containing protein n=1 Tax=Chaetomium tenue TaxID=1854479 RepID=A0ACB7PKS8_9PEZI|nr:Fructosamine kinase-domain-containing protein [Chaetomium globosum]